MPDSTGSSIVVVGSLNVDLVVRTQCFPKPGETIMGTSFARYSGGKGANQAVAAARLGARVYMIGRVGADLFGENQVQSLQAYGVDTHAIMRTENSATGVAVITVEEETGQNQIIIVPGANGCITANDIMYYQPLLSAATVVVAQLEIPLSAVEQTAQVAKNAGATFILNPAPAQNLAPDLLAMVDVFTPNEHETEQLTGISVSSLAGARQAAGKLRNMGVGSVIITLGNRGVYGLYAGGEFTLPVYTVPVVDTVAAGDAFTGALAVALAENMPLPDAASFANAAAAISVTRQGAQPSLPHRDEVMNLWKQGQ